MKLKTFICSGIGAIIAAGGITAAVTFAGVEKQSTPFLRVVTKETYLHLKDKQGITSPTQPVVIDYGSLPTSGVSFMDLLTTNIDANAFIITTGSQAYKQTRSILYDSDANETLTTIADSSALMLKLYDLFYNENNDRHNLVENYASSMNFYSFIDIVLTKETDDAANLLHKRRTQMGDKFPEPTGADDKTGEDLVASGRSKLWEVPIEKESTKTEDLPVVKTSSGTDIVAFDYKPTDAYYEFRKDNKIDTEYEKVYFRNQNYVKQYKDTINWASSFSSSFLTGASFSDEGSVVCAKKQDNHWYFSSYTSGGEETLNSIINFYTKEEEPPQPSEEAPSEQQPAPTPEEPTPPPSPEPVPPEAAPTYKRIIKKDLA